MLFLNDETLLDRAASNFRIALKNYRDSLGDERELNYVGYWLQQATELCIKHHLELNGIRYSHTHDIEDLLDERIFLRSPSFALWDYIFLPDHSLSC